MRRRFQVLAALAVAAAGPFAAALEEACAESLALGVAPFEVEAPPGAGVPDVASLLADRLVAQGVGRVVRPTELGAVADADAASSTVMGWADSGDLDAVVVGRTTRTGDQLSVDVRLREGGTGDVADAFVREVASPDQLDAVLETLASLVLDAAGSLGAAPAAPPLPAATGDDSPFGVGGWRSDEPLEIESEQLDVTEKDGRRHLLFEGNVRAVQGDLVLEAARLEAIYPPGGGDPERLIANGKVRLTKGEQLALCDQAVYDRVRDLLSCRGNASFRDGDSTLAGKVIDIDLETEIVKVKGRASVVIEPEPQSEPAPQLTEGSP